MKIEKAQNNIVVANSCNYEMLNGSDIRMLAGNLIQMKPGFHAANGSIIHTKINSDCVPENVQRAADNISNGSKYINAQEKAKLTLSPNPAIEELNISLSNVNAEKVTLIIFDNKGKQQKVLLENFSINNLSTAHFYFSINKLNLKRGAYVVKAQLGCEILTTKLVIQ
ncbi:MAG TPA: T9SS type A sorting domain-containing protein [Bacteroidia bacterium]|nr:T9SS type A sorting domain-containing protein [Bacteroidia bacterium]